MRNKNSRFAYTKYNTHLFEQGASIGWFYPCSRRKIMKYLPSAGFEEKGGDRIWVRKVLWCT
jgi:hypothetical protein